MAKKIIKASNILGDNYYVYELSSSNYTPELNEEIIITCTMKNVYGNVIANKNITLYQNGSQVNEQITNNNGVATWTITCEEEGMYMFNVGTSNIEVYVVENTLINAKTITVPRSLHPTQANLYNTWEYDESINDEAEVTNYIIWYDYVFGDWEVNFTITDNSTLETIAFDTGNNNGFNIHIDANKEHFIVGSLYSKGDSGYADGDSYAETTPRPSSNDGIDSDDTPSSPDCIMPTENVIIKCKYYNEQYNEHVVISCYNSNSPNTLISTITLYGCMFMPYIVVAGTMKDSVISENNYSNSNNFVCVYDDDPTFTSERSCIFYDDNGKVYFNDLFSQSKTLYDGPTIAVESVSTYVDYTNYVSQVCQNTSDIDFTKPSKVILDVEFDSDSIDIANEIISQIRFGNDYNYYDFIYHDGYVYSIQSYDGLDTDPTQEQINAWMPKQTVIGSSTNLQIIRYYYDNGVILTKIDDTFILGFHDMANGNEYLEIIDININYSITQHIPKKIVPTLVTDLDDANNYYTKSEVDSLINQLRQELGG